MGPRQMALLGALGQQELRGQASQPRLKVTCSLPAAPPGVAEAGTSGGRARVGPGCTFCSCRWAHDSRTFDGRGWGGASGPEPTWPPNGLAACPLAGGAWVGQGCGLPSFTPFLARHLSPPSPPCSQAATPAQVPREHSRAGRMDGCQQLPNPSTSSIRPLPARHWVPLSHATSLAAAELLGAPQLDPPWLWSAALSVACLLPQSWSCCDPLPLSSPHKSTWLVVTVPCSNLSLTTRNVPSKVGASFGGHF